MPLDDLKQLGLIVAAFVGVIATLIKIWEFIVRPKFALRCIARAYPSFGSLMDKAYLDAKFAEIVEQICKYSEEIESPKRLQRDLEFAIKHWTKYTVPPSLTSTGTAVRISLTNAGNSPVTKIRVLVNSQEGFMVLEKGRPRRDEISSSVIEIDEIRPKESVDVVVWSSFDHEYWRERHMSVSHSAGPGKVIFAREATSRWELFVLKVSNPSFMWALFTLLSMSYLLIYFLVRIGPPK